MLILLTYDKFNNNIFNLRLHYINNKIPITQIEKGFNMKRGWLLNLFEVYEMICNIYYNCTYLHDAVIDVKLTKCVYNYLDKKPQFNIRLLKLYFIRTQKNLQNIRYP